MDRHAQLVELGNNRKAKTWPGYKGINEFFGGILECDFVSPYTKTARNQSADVFVMLQDWCSEKWLLEQSDTEIRQLAELGYSPSLDTNRNLISLLRSTFALVLSEIYGTNLFPFIKPLRMSSGIPMSDMQRAAKEFGLPQIEILKPKLVICLGLDTFDALRCAFGGAKSRNLSDAIESPYSVGKTRFWCQAHTGYWGQKRGEKQIIGDWQAMKADPFIEKFSP